MEKDSCRKYQEIENQMYMAQGKNRTMQISIGISFFSPLPQDDEIMRLNAMFKGMVVDNFGPTRFRDEA
nr:hypothetical protein CFP56_55492 [Quercus suber]